MGNQYDADNEIEIDLKELLLELLSYWKIIALVMILTGAIGYAVSTYLITPMYESTSELYVQTKSTSITSLTDIQTSTSLTNDYIVVVRERPVLEQVIKNLKINETYRSLYEKVSVNNPSNSRFLQITVTDADPDRAKDIADEIADVSAAFISEKMDQDPPEVIHYGYSDGTAVSPNVMKNTAIGAIVGMLLTATIITLSYLFNDTIMGPEDIEKKLGMNVLGTLPLEESEDDGEKKTGGRKKRKQTKQGRQKKKSA